MITFFELAHMVGATQVMGWDGMEIISYTLIVVCCLECELFPKCLSMFM